MRIFKALFLGLLFLTGSLSCTNTKVTSDQIEVSGIVQQQGLTTYQYGTHILSSNNKIYALRSNTINLDDYLNNKVSIIAKKIAGYPVENGPDFLEVIKVK